MKIQESGENYLETILLLNKRNGYVRSVDIANELNYSKPSISRAVGVLKKAGYIEMQKDGNLLLTPSGKAKAEEIYSRHSTIKAFLSDVLNVSDEIAEQDACKIEHVISKETFSALKCFLESKS